MQVRPEVVGCHQIEIADTRPDQKLDSLDRFVHTQCFAHVLCGELVVLAEKATAGTAGQEDGSRTTLSDKWWLFAKMCTNRGNAKFGAFATEAMLPRDSINAATPRA